MLLMVGSGHIVRISDPPRRDRINPHLWPQADRHGVGQGDKGPLGRGVGFRLRLGHEGAGRSHVDHARPFLQAGNDCTAHQKGAGQVTVEDAAPCLQRQFGQRTIRGISDAGVVDQKIELGPPQILKGGGDRGFVADVAQDLPRARRGGLLVE